MSLELEFCRDEYSDYIIYRELAKRESNPEFKKILEAFAEHEKGHYEFWRELAGGCSGADWLKVNLVMVSRRLLGLTFTLKLLERHESRTIEAYKSYLERLEGEHRRRLEEIINDELTHEKTWLNNLAEREGLVRYLGFIALGLADAIVEITGVHTGFLGATATTLVAGVAGLIVGFSAAIAMAGAAYLQAKHGGVEKSLNPVVSALVTGVSYIVAVVSLAIPYFLTKSMLLAFSLSLILAIALIFSFAFYGAVVNDREFRREALENVIILFATAIAAFLFGTFLGEVTGIRGLAH